LKLGDGKALVVLAVVALIVLPIVDVSLALANPESAKRSSQSIDQVNAWNDLARTPGTPCSYEEGPMEAPAWGAP
jgi:hypothetical protein